MSKESNLRKKTVELQPGAPRPSRIRREPPPQPQTALAKKLDRIDWRSPEWEKRVVIVGVTLFALAFFIIAFGVSDITSH